MKQTEKSGTSHSFREPDRVESDRTERASPLCHEVMTDTTIERVETVHDHASAPPHVRLPDRHSLLTLIFTTNRRTSVAISRR